MNNILRVNSVIPPHTESALAHWNNPPAVEKWGVITVGVHISIKTVGGYTEVFIAPHRCLGGVYQNSRKTSIKHPRRGLLYTPQIAHWYNPPHPKKGKSWKKKLGEPKIRLKCVQACFGSFLSLNSSGIQRLNIVKNQKKQKNA